jgi:hypothetical protein
VAQNAQQWAEGPLAWRNWVAANGGAVRNGGFEYGLYTDALVEGDLSTGPYDWLNTLAGSARPVVGNATPAVTLRVALHLTNEEFTSVDFDNPGTKDYLGGDIGDEMASLMSLALGRRMRSSGLTRRFEEGGDGRGIPFSPWHSVPSLAAPRPGTRSILPMIEEGVELEDAGLLLEIYPGISVQKARALARAARLYAQALWIADDDPAQAWLRLVSALEAAASHWKAPKEPLDRLKAADPELGELVEQAGDVAGPLAKKLAPVTKATAKLLDFTLTHLPPPPERRPAYGQVEWGTMEKALRTIYKHRSLDLHEGTPFPGPLCEVPQRDGDGVEMETVHSLGVAGQGGVWTEDDLPLQLHTFAYVAGGALRTWWQRLGA